MGNCLESISSHDDVSLLRDTSNIQRDSSTDQLAASSADYHQQFQVFLYRNSETSEKF